MNFREIGGVRYATLDDIEPSGTTTGTQVDPLNLPQGWHIAPSNAASEAAASQYGWATDCLVLADGSMISTNPNVPCNEGQLVTDASAFRPKHKRILIAQSGTVGFAFQRCVRVCAGKWMSKLTCALPVVLAGCE